LENKEYNLTSNDSMLIYIELKKSYYKLHLYPEVFKVNTDITRLIKKGIAHPLWSYNINSKLYSNLLQYDKATVALKKEIKELKSYNTKDKLIIPSAYNDLGFYYFAIKKFDSALVNYNRSLTYADEVLKNTETNQYQNLTAVIKGNIANVYVNKKMYKEAIPLLLEDISVSISLKANKKNIVHSYNLLTTCYLELKEFNNVVKTLKAMKFFVNKLPNSSILVDYLKNKASYYNSVKEADSSNYYFNRAFIMKDSIDMKRYFQIFSSNELIYKISENKKLVEAHKIDLKNQAIKIKNNQKNILLFFTIGLFTLLMLSLYKTYSLKKSRKEITEKNKQILLKSNQVKVALSEKEMLLKEVHHRVKNNLQIISGLLELQNISIADENVKVLLQEGQNRIQSVALVHKLMYQSDDISKVNMQKYLEECYIQGSNATNRCR